ncbi:taste receptor type 2 member 140-like [Marmota flaviventris]|uniref:taste receptor type 2 member 140-like n=1 Tax=Marmota flaviventris TaxID=93162 RepID=UPI003A86F42F
MNGVVQNIFGVILNVELVIGSLGNGFIALVNCVDWVKRRKISLVDQILTGLALSRIVVLWSNMVYLLVSSLYPGLMITGNMLRIIFSIWTVANYISVWLATSLSIFYFFKIANFSYSFFLYLRWRVRIVISATLLVSLVLLFLNIILISTQFDVWNSGYKGNLSYSSSLSNVEHLCNLFFINTMFMLISFIVSLTTILLLIFSLWKHLKRMQHSVKGSRDASATAHVKALQTVTTFLLLYVIYFLSHFVQVWKFPEKYLIVSLIWVIGAAFPSGHSFVLILGNSKLRQASQSVLWWLRCWSKDVEPSDP